MLCRIAILLLIAAIVALLHTMQRLPKCPRCFYRVRVDWYGQVGYCPRCAHPGWGAAPRAPVQIADMGARRIG